MSAFETIIPDCLSRLYTERNHSPGVVLDGRLLIISGMLGRDSDLKVVEDPEDQFVQIFENMGAVLREGGCGWPDVIELTGYFTSIRRDFDLFMDVRKRYIEQPHPSMTMIGVAELAQPGLICELRGMAVIQGNRV